MLILKGLEHGFKMVNLAGVKSVNRLGQKWTGRAK